MEKGEKTGEEVVKKRRSAGERWGGKKRANRRWKLRRQESMQEDGGMSRDVGSKRADVH